MAQSILVPDTEWSSQTVTLGGTNFIIELKYKARTDRWYFTLKTTEGELVLSEKKCVPKTSLTALYDIEGLFGDIYVERTFGSDDYPGRNTFGLGKEFELKYYSEDEVNALIQIPL